MINQLKVKASLILLTACFFVSSTISAQTCTPPPPVGMIVGYTPVPVTGFNVDVVANGVGAPATSTTADVDGVNFFFVDNTFRNTAGGPVPTYYLPSSNKVNSNGIPGLRYTLENYTGNNSLRINTTGDPSTLTLVTPQKGSSVFLLVTSGSGASTIDVSVRFTDGTSQTFSGLSIADWYGGTPYAIQGIGRVGAGGVLEGTTTDPRLYDITLNLNAANYTKDVSKIVVTRTSAAGVVQVMAVSMLGTIMAPGCFHTPETNKFFLLNPPTGTGVTYQWQQSDTPGGIYIDAVGGSGATTTAYTTPVLTSTVYYTCRITCSAGGQSQSNEIGMPVNNPQVTGTTPASRCGSGTIDLQASGSALSILKWFTASTGGALVGTGTAYTTPVITMTTNYYVSATAENACYSPRTTVAATINPLAPTIAANVVNSSACGATDGSIAITNTAAYTSYAWSNAAGNVSSVSNLATGTYIATATTAVGCSTQRSFVVNSTGAPVLSTSSISSVTCYGGSNGVISLSVAPAFAGTATYTWNPGNMTTSVPSISGLSVGTYNVFASDGTCSSVLSSLIVNQASLIVPVTTVTNTSCAIASDGKINTSASGGTGALTYSWNTTPAQTTANVSGLATGTYTLTVTDAATCLVNTSAVISYNIAPSIVATFANVTSCGFTNGRIQVMNTSNYASYTWSNGGSASFISALPVGTYSLTATSAAGCQSFQTYTIGTNTTRVLNFVSKTNVSCNGGNNGRIQVVPSPGFISSPTYTWNPGGITTSVPSISGLTAGTYTVTATDGNCNASASAAIVVTEPLSITVNASSTNVTCPGFSNGTVGASATGGTGAYNYTWSTSPVTSSATVSGLGVGSYTVTVKDANNCTAQTTVDITAANLQPTASFTYTINGGTVNFINTSTNATSYSWNFGNSSTSTAQNPTHTYGAGNTYNVSLIVSNNCGSNSTSLPVMITVGINENSTMKGINVYPNPSNGLVTIKIDQHYVAKVAIEIMDIQGKIMHTGKVESADPVSIDMSSLPKGVYYIKMSTATEIATRKLIIQ